MTTSTRGSRSAKRAMHAVIKALTEEEKRIAEARAD